MLSTNLKSRVSIFMALILALTLAPSIDTRATGHGVTRIDGDIAGTAYTLLRPEIWNGDLVLLVHGSVPDDFEALAPGLKAQGFGVAFVTLTATVADGDGDAYRIVTIATKQVQSQFTSHFGQPGKTYLFGFSRGTHNMARLLETSSGRYDGMLSVCGYRYGGGRPVRAPLCRLQ